MSPRAAPTHAGTAPQPLPSVGLYWPPETPIPIATRMTGAVTIVKLEGTFTADNGVAEFGDTIRTSRQTGCPIRSGAFKLLTIFETFDTEAAAIASFAVELRRATVGYPEVTVRVAAPACRHRPRDSWFTWSGWLTFC